MSAPITHTGPIVLFDGVCNLCNHSVQFIIKRDPDARFRFAALQSPVGEALCQQYGIDPTKTDSVILIQNKKAQTHSSAALRIARQLRGPVKILYLLIIIPYFLRDLVYNLIARNRYRWYGKKESCMIPTPDLKSRFLT
ncbi:MAG: thiol-disulfide oxidoreductase DCC family protein [Ferruginibacter sp.]